MAAGNILRLKPLEYAHVLDLVSFTIFCTIFITKVVLLNHSYLFVFLATQCWLNALSLDGRKDIQVVKLFWSICIQSLKLKTCILTLRGVKRDLKWTHTHTHTHTHKDLDLPIFFLKLFLSLSNTDISEFW